VSSIAYSQTISTEELARRVLKDSVTYSWEQANEFVNGLENEKRLTSAFNLAKLETLALSMAYEESEKRNKDFKNITIPAFEKTVEDLLLNAVDLTTLNEAAKQEIKVQIKKKWKWGVIGTALGVLIGVLVGG
jgi:hypothetical protein